jgi:hypothetical protein
MRWKEMLIATSRQAQASRSQSAARRSGRRWATKAATCAAMPIRVVRSRWRVGGWEVAGLALPEHADLPVVERGLCQLAGAGHAVPVRLDVGEHVVDDLVEQVLLAAEVAVQGGRPDGDGVGDVGHGHLGVAVAREQVGGGGDDQLPPVAGSGAAGWRSGGVALDLGRHGATA